MLNVTGLAAVMRANQYIERIQCPRQKSQLKQCSWNDRNQNNKRGATDTAKTNEGKWIDSKQTIQKQYNKNRTNLSNKSGN